MYVEEVLALTMFLALALLLFSGYPVAFVLPGVALGFGAIGMMLGHVFTDRKRVPDNQLTISQAGHLPRGREPSKLIKAPYRLEML